MERRLAAILAADVVGYSRLMERDEAGTLAALKSHRQELIDPAISQHHGRTVKLMGDGALVEFASVVDAVTCAVAIQTGIAVRNDGVPEDRRFDLRIGGRHLRDPAPHHLAGPASAAQRVRFLARCRRAP